MGTGVCTFEYKRQAVNLPSAGKWMNGRDESNVYEVIREDGLLTGNDEQFASFAKVMDIPQLG